jgi:hypothetical protein
MEAGPQATKIVDLSEVIPPMHELLSGEQWGREIRGQAELDRLDHEPGRVVIQLPEWVMSVTTSFIRGFLRDSVLTLGGDGFRTKYELAGHDFGDLVEEEISRAERTRQYREVA